MSKKKKKKERDGVNVHNVQEMLFYNVPVPEEKCTKKKKRSLKMLYSGNRI